MDHSSPRAITEFPTIHSTIFLWFAVVVDVLIPSRDITHKTLCTSSLLRDESLIPITWAPYYNIYRFL